MMYSLYENNNNDNNEPILENRTGAPILVVILCKNSTIPETEERGFHCAEK